MARIKSLIAILLALALIVSPMTAALADGPDDPGRNDGEVIDGHPWDDKAVSSDPGPGNDPNTPGQSPSSGYQNVTVPSTATLGSGAQFVAQALRTIMDTWLRISETKASKSKTVRRIR
jgi:hypothetical protein